MKALDEEIPRLEIGLGGDRFWKFFVAKSAMSLVMKIETGSRLLEHVAVDRGLVARVNFLRSSSDDL